MKLSSDPNHPDYHYVVNFIDKIHVNNVPITSCVSFDTEADEAVCFQQPLKVIDGDQLATHVIKGRIGLTWREMPRSINGLIGDGSADLQKDLYRKWVEREALRAKQPTQPTNETPPHKD